MEQQIQSIKIDKDGRYIILVHHSVKWDESLFDHIEKIRQRIEDWWNSREKFLMIGVDDGVEVQFERISDETTTTD